MRRKGVWTMLGVWLLAAAIVCPQIKAQSNKPEPPPKLKVGDVAPDFKLQYFDGSDEKEISLSQYRGKSNVVLAFYIFAFTGGWTAQMKAFQQNLKTLEAADTQVLGVSVDSPFANKAFADQIGVTFPLLSDWGGDVTRQYGVYVDKYKAARRVNFLIGKDGKILEEQIDKDAIDPKKIVDACERKKVSRWIKRAGKAEKRKERVRFEFKTSMNASGSAKVITDRMRN